MNGRLRRLQEVERGFVSLALPVLLWVTTIVALFTIDLGAYLVAAARAQQLADAAALAAVSSELGTARTRSPEAEAERVVAAGEGELETCGCRPGADIVKVAVSVPVPGLLLPKLGASRVTAYADAVLVEP